ncbi:7688_t:CDS:2 [Ambispora gerdemannii]|uniref:7688_t:CDS:1 n=1 Tax=Ambispora gerdemannii TaxID=144530 RepID=A0A9N9C5B9_9GLOM|nr:7688_t:CDS:2 [Ambispora gerdemannii]
MPSSKSPWLICSSSSRSHRNYSSLWSVAHLYLTCLFSFFGISDSFSPYPRYAHSALLINENIYFVGGQVFNTTYQTTLPSKDFFYLNVSKEFTTISLPWTDLSDLSGLAENSWTATAVGGSNQDQLFLLGGAPWNISDPLVFMFDTRIRSWSTPKISELPPSRRREFSAVSDGSSHIFCFGGLEDKATTNKPDTNTTFSNEMVVLDTIELSWVMKSTIRAPLPRADSAATLLSNGQILYVGGRQANGQFVLMNEIWLYDTKSLMWSSVTAIGNTPLSRYGHTAALTSDGRLIIHGGINVNSTQPNSDIYVLNIAISPFEWSRPQFDNGVTPRAYHTATMVNNYMIVAFGMESDTGSTTLNILDANDPTNYTWVISFNPVRKPTLEMVTGTKTGNTRLIVAVVGGAFAATLFGILGLLYYRHRQRTSAEQNEKTPGYPIIDDNNPNELSLIRENSIPSNFSNSTNSNQQENTFSSNITVTPHTTPPTTPTSAQIPEQMIKRVKHNSIPGTPRRSHTSGGSGGGGIIPHDLQSQHFQQISASSSSSSRSRRHRFSLPITSRLPISSDQVDQTERASDQPENFFVTREVQTISVPRLSLFVVNPDLNSDSGNGDR